MLNRAGFSTGDAYVTRHDPVTGDLVDVFIADDPGTPELENGGITIAHDIEIGPDGLLYCTNMASDLPGVPRFDMQTGALVDYFGTTSPAIFPGTIRPLEFRDGIMYQSNINGGDTFRFDVTTGAFIDELIPGNTPVVGIPLDLEFDLQGDLIMGTAGTPVSLLRFDAGTGALQQSIPSASDFVAAIAVMPLPEDLDGDGRVGVNDLLELLAAWGPCAAGPCPADVDGDGMVGTTDLLALLAAWVD